MRRVRPCRFRGISIANCSTRCLGHQPEGAWNDFVDRYMGLIYHVIHHVAHARSVPRSTDADVEDVAADILPRDRRRRLQGPPRLQGEQQLAAHLSDGRRRSGLRPGDRPRGSASPSWATRTPHRSSVDDDASAEVEPIIAAEEVEADALAPCPSARREVVKLYHLKYLNYRQIGKQLGGIPENSVGPDPRQGPPESQADRRAALAELIHAHVGWRRASGEPHP